MVINKVWVFVWDSHVVEEGLDLLLVPASLDQVVDHENFSGHEEVLRQFHHLLHFVFHQVVDVHSSASLGLLWVGFDVSRCKIADELVWNFGQDLFGKAVRVILDLTERHELHNISGSVSIQLLAEQRCIISIKQVHLIEVCSTNTNNNDGEW